jgi:hypothetical protein
MKTPIRKVRLDVGMNPVARAVAAQALRKTLVDIRIAMHMLDHNERCMDRLGSLPLMLRAMKIAMPHHAPLSDRASITRAIDILTDIESRDGRWRLDDLAPMDEAMGVLGNWWYLAPARIANEAIQSAMKEINK